MRLLHLARLLECYSAADAGAARAARAAWAAWAAFAARLQGLVLIVAGILLFKHIPILPGGLFLVGMLMLIAGDWP